MTSPILTLTDIHRWYGDAGNRVQVLDGVDLTLKARESVAIVGPSGSGKSTLLHIAGLLDKPNRGQVIVNGQDTAQMTDAQLSAIRNQHMGFVYQHHHLLREFTATENVGMPGLIGGTANPTRAVNLLKEVGLGHRLNHYPTQLSGGEQQRVAIARALMNKPSLLLADEPTGNLDPHTAEAVTDMLFSLIEKEDMAALIVTHNMDLARRCKRRIEMG